MAALIGSFISIAVCVLLIASKWRLYTKAGEAGWKCLIPVYNDYVWYRLVWDTKAFYRMLAAAVLFIIPYTIVVMESMANMLTYTFGGSTGSAWTGFSSVRTVILGIVAAAAGIWLFVISVRLQFKAAKAYGKGTGFGLLLMFLNIIGYPILAFGSAEYVLNSSGENTGAGDNANGTPEDDDGLYYDDDSSDPAGGSQSAYDGVNAGMPEQPENGSETPGAPAWENWTREEQKKPTRIGEMEDFSGRQLPEFKDEPQDPDVPEGFYKL